MNWQYQTLRSSGSMVAVGGVPTPLDVALNALGKEGWDLVHVVAEQPGNGQNLLFLKRPLPSAAPAA